MTHSSHPSQQQNHNNNNNNNNTHNFYYSNNNKSSIDIEDTTNDNDDSFITPTMIHIHPKITPLISNPLNFTEQQQQQQQEQQQESEQIELKTPRTTTGSFSTNSPNFSSTTIHVTKNDNNNLFSQHHQQHHSRNENSIHSRENQNSPPIQISPPTTTTTFSPTTPTTNNYENHEKAQQNENENENENNENALFQFLRQVHQNIILHFYHQFKQQELYAWQPVLSPYVVIPFMYTLGTIFIGLGVALYFAHLSITQYQFTYANFSDKKNPDPAQNVCWMERNESLGGAQHCQQVMTLKIDRDMQPPIFMFYGMKEFYQNARQFAKSYSDAQLMNSESNVNMTYEDLKDNCQGLVYYDDAIRHSEKKKNRNATNVANNYFFSSSDMTGLTGLTGLTGEVEEMEAMEEEEDEAKNGTQRERKSILNPCGWVAYSMFNDTFVLYRENSTLSDDSINSSGGENDDNDEEKSKIVVCDTKHEIGCTKRGIAWKSDQRKKYVKPKQATHYRMNNLTYANESTHVIPDIEDEDFIVWMKPAPLSTFRKLYRIINEPILRGEYKLRVDQNFPVAEFGGSKFIVLSTMSWAGGENRFMSLSFMVLGGVWIILATLFILVVLIHIVKFRIAIDKERRMKERQQQQVQQLQASS